MRAASCRDPNEASEPGVKKAGRFHWSKCMTAPVSLRRVERADAIE